MTFTRVSPGTGRIGPGSSFVYTNDLVGPVVPGTEFHVAIRDVATHTEILSNQFVVTTTTATGKFGVRSTTNSLGSGANGIADGAAVEIRAYWIVPGSGVVDNLVETGFTWDAVSLLAVVIDQDLLAWLQIFPGQSSKLDAILAAVKRVYSTP